MGNVTRYGKRVPEIVRHAMEYLERRARTAARLRGRPH